MGQITELIARARGRERDAFDALFQALYPELKRLAHARLARNQRGTLMETTALLHECCLRFLAGGSLKPGDRAHFIAYAAHVELDTGIAEALSLPEDEILDVDRALRELAQLEPRLAQVVAMRDFTGMKETEIALALGLTERTVRRDWEKARLLLAHALQG